MRSALAVCRAGPADAASQVFSILDFQFEDGSVLPDLHIAYETRGTLAPGRDNAILLLPGAIGDRHAFDAMVGSGKTFDTDKYFVITVDPIGGGVLDLRTTTVDTLVLPVVFLVALFLQVISDDFHLATGVYIRSMNTLVGLRSTGVPTMRLLPGGSSTEAKAGITA